MMSGSVEVPLLCHTLSSTLIEGQVWSLHLQGLAGVFPDRKARDLGISVPKIRETAPNC